MFVLESFFFQAEDGIRDGRVTGVQTCALPISGDRHLNRIVTNEPGVAAIEMTVTGATLRFDADAVIALTGATMEARLDGEERSEERRVGKECRSPWTPYH